jgi:hypothetical protein
MGEATRRREQFRKTPPTCVFCGGIATTRDHVPPKNLFIPPRPRLITVPACETCNASTSALEDEFRVFVSAKIGPNTPEWIEFWEKGARRAVHSNARLRREFRSGMGLWARSPYGYGQTYKWPRETHDKVIEKITRGLYYHHFHEILEPTTSLEIIFLTELNAELKQTILSMRCCDVGGAGRFAYAFGRLAEERQVSLWIYQFYMRHWAGVITRPEFLDIAGLEGDIRLSPQPPLG